MKVTSDTTILLTGAHYNFDGEGDLTAFPLRVYWIYDNNATIKWGVGIIGGKTTVVDTVTDDDPANITNSYQILTDSALTAGTWSCDDIFWFLADRDDTGGASEDLWSVNTGAGSLNVGKADGVEFTYDPNFPVGFSAAPTIITAKASITGNICSVQIRVSAGTSDSTLFQIQAPFKCGQDTRNALAQYTDNGAGTRGEGYMTILTGGLFFNIFPTAGSWTASGVKDTAFQVEYVLAES